MHFYYPNSIFILSYLKYILFLSGQIVISYCLVNYIQLKMNLKQRMQKQNKNNSSIMNNSNFDFGQVSKEDQMYERSRRQCEQELNRRKNQLEYERAHMIKIKEKEMTMVLQKFNNDFQDIRKQIINMINHQLTQTKSRMIAEIKEKKSADTNQEIHIKKNVDEMLNRINTHLMGLRQNQYREYIAKIVTTDFDTGKEQIKQSIRKMKYPVPATQVDEKLYNCFRSDLAKMIQINFSSKSQYSQGIGKQSDGSQYHIINMHQNRDKLKKVGI